MSSNQVLLERHDGITVVRLNRPPANALCLELGREVEAVLDSEAVKRAKALVLTGVGEFFSGGLDLKAVPAYARDTQREFLGLVNCMVGTLYGLPCPVVGAVNGHAVAGGLVLALTTDYRVGPEGDARFGLTEGRVGIPFPAGPLIVVRAELAPQEVRRTTLSARMFGPAEAHARGILDELQPPRTLLERSLEVARDLAAMPADAYHRIKHQVRGPALAELQRVIEAGADPMLQDWLSPDARQASAAQLEMKHRRGRAPD